MLNPSTATATDDDATISRVVGFSRSWEFGSATVVNLFALRTPHPHELRLADDPVGEANDEIIVATSRTSDQVITAWGNHGSLDNPVTGAPRSEEVQKLLDGAGVSTLCLGRTKLGEPRHPLYLPGSTVPYPA